jgi:60S ribosome subunit biogenesis protein NIP7
MRPLSEEETAQLLGKLGKFIGVANIKSLLDRSDDEYVFRLQNNRVYYVSATVLKNAQNITRKQLLSLGVCFGKFTHSKQFHLTVTCLDYLAKLAKYKVW